MAKGGLSVRRVASFGRRWGLSILIGAASGLSYIVLTMDALSNQFGEVVSGALASFAGIGLGVLLAVFVAMLSQLMRLNRSSQELPRVVTSPSAE